MTCEHASPDGVHETTRSALRVTSSGVEVNAGEIPESRAGATTFTLNASTVPPPAVTASVAPGAQESALTVALVAT
jgi:hypothetical protein